MNRWPKDNTADLKAYYGNPTGLNGRSSVKWERENLVKVNVPWIMVLSWDKSVRVTSILFHRKAASALARVLTDLWEHSNRDQKTIETAGLHLYGGSFNYRPKRGLASLSVHAFGAAVDFDPERNGLGDTTPYMPRHVVEAFKREGATWGGDFKRRDGMHFQFADV